MGYSATNLRTRQACTTSWNQKIERQLPKYGTSNGVESNSTAAASPATIGTIILLLFLLIVLSLLLLHLPLRCITSAGTPPFDGRVPLVPRIDRSILQMRHSCVRRRRNSNARRYQWNRHVLYDGLGSGGCWAERVAMQMLYRCSGTPAVLFRPPHPMIAALMYSACILLRLPVLWYPCHHTVDPDDTELPSGEYHRYFDHADHEWSLTQEEVHLIATPSPLSSLREPCKHNTGHVWVAVDAQLRRTARPPTRRVLHDSNPGTQKQKKPKITQEGFSFTCPGPSGCKIVMELEARSRSLRMDTERTEPIPLVLAR